MDNLSEEQINKLNLLTEGLISHLSEITSATKVTEGFYCELMQQSSSGKWYKITVKEAFEDQGSNQVQ